MGSAVTIFIPAFLRYDLREVDGEWKVARLRAYWELPQMMLVFLKTGSGALAPGFALARGLLGNQGPHGTVGFMTGFRRVGRNERTQSSVQKPEQTTRIQLIRPPSSVR